MCESIARAGNGLCLMATTAETIIGKCSRLVRASRTYILKNVTVDWGVRTNLAEAYRTGRTELKGVRQAPIEISSIYPGNRFAVFALIEDDEFDPPREIVIRAQRDGLGEILQFSVPVQIVDFPSHRRSLIQTLAARRAIMDIDDGKHNTISPEAKSLIIRLGTTYQLASRFTSFIAVDNRTRTHTHSDDEEFINQRIPGAFVSPDPRPSSSYRGGAAEDFVSFIAPMHRIQQDSLSPALPNPRPPHGPPAPPPPMAPPSAMLRPAAPPPPSRRAPPPPPPRYRNDRLAALLPPGSGAVPSQMQPLISTPTASGHLTVTPDSASSPFSLASIQEFFGLSKPASQASSSKSVSRVDACCAVETICEEDELCEEIQQLVDMMGVGEDDDLPIDASINTTEDKAIHLIRLQSFDGSFPAEDRLLGLLGLGSFAEAQTLGISEKVWATILAVVWLKKHMKDQPELLDGLVEKAIEFVEGLRDLDVDKLLTRAQAILTKE